MILDDRNQDNSRQMRPLAGASAAEVLIAQCQAADAALDPDRFVSLLTPDVVFRMGSQPELRGRAEVLRAVAGLFEQLQAIHHRTIRIWEHGNQVAIRAEVTFSRKDGRRYRFPYVNTLSITAENLISDYRIHIDVSPMLAA